MMDIRETLNGTLMREVKRGWHYVENQGVREDKCLINSSYVNMVTALLGTVRRRLIDSPLYRLVHPSLRISFREV